MNPEIEKLVTNLAAQLHVGADHLYAALQRQAIIDSTSRVILFFLAILIGIIVSSRLRKAIPEADEDPVALMVAVGLVVCLVVCFISALVLAGDASMISAGFFNRDYWILKQFIR